MITTATKIYLARALRDFGDGFVALLLPVYLAARGFGAATADAGTATTARSTAPGAS